MNQLFESEYQFPDPSSADENGIVCIGADLAPDTLLHAYSRGLFPWFNEGEPIIWWCPNPRCVLWCANVKESRSMKRFLKKTNYTITYDTAFDQVISNCQTIKRKGEQGTWITNKMKNAYIKMHYLGYAHSVEVWDEDQLIGGIYGLIIGKCFFGESMFSKKTNASKMAMINLSKHLLNNNIDLIDCQVYNNHLASMGAIEIDRTKFLALLKERINN